MALRHLWENSRSPINFWRSAAIGILLSTGRKEVALSEAAAGDAPAINLEDIDNMRI
jgi:hypothetical protein